MPGQRYSDELIVAKLQDAERLTGTRQHRVVCRKPAFPEQTLYRSHRGN